MSLAPWLPVTKIHMNGDSCDSDFKYRFGSIRSRMSTTSLKDQNANLDERVMRVIRVTTDEEEEEKEDFENTNIVSY